MSNETLEKRIKPIQKGSKAGKCVLYVMSRDQRIAYNHALLAAQKHAEAKGLPLAVVFCLYERSGFRAREHYDFMLAGLKEVEASLRRFNIPFIFLVGNPLQRITALMHHVEPDAVYFDFSPLRGSHTLLEKIAKFDRGQASLYIVDTHNVIPMWIASDKKEVAAYTMRPKIHRHLAEFLRKPDALRRQTIPWPGEVRSINELAVYINTVFSVLPANGSKIVHKSGSAAAAKVVENFIGTRLQSYAERRNDPSAGYVSDLSPYLHFGHISALEVALRLQEELAKSNDTLHILESPKMPQPSGSNVVCDGVNALLEELLVRKELSDNFCYNEPHYSDLAGAPQWAQTTLDQHRADPREHLYSYKELAGGLTHDPAWNAAQMQMVRSGKMHGYMRMYWAKKVLEWTKSPEHAIAFLIRLNDFYSIDGGDPNGYVGILWSVAGVHDRPWTERSVFGKIRYMNYGGLKRKFDIEAYERKWT